MFLRKISVHGPKTRSKRSLSNFTHLIAPRATTVAALGRLSTSAISPKTLIVTNIITQTCPL